MKEIFASHPAAYLQKPVNANALNVAINQAIDRNQSGSRQQADTNSVTGQAHNSVNDSIFFVKEGTVYKKLDWNDISHITAGKNYVSVFNVADQAEYFIRNSLQKTLQHLIPKMLQDNFIQVNRSQIVQFSHIKEISNDQVVTEFKSLALSDTYNKAIKSRMNIV